MVVTFCHFACSLLHQPRLYLGHPVRYSQLPLITSGCPQRWQRLAGSILYVQYTSFKQTRQGDLAPNARPFREQRGRQQRSRRKSYGLCYEKPTFKRSGKVLPVPHLHLHFSLELAPQGPAPLVLGAALRMLNKCFSIEPRPPPPCYTSFPVLRPRYETMLWSYFLHCGGGTALDNWAVGMQLGSSPMRGIVGFSPMMQLPLSPLCSFE